MQLVFWAGPGIVQGSQRLEGVLRCNWAPGPRYGSCSLSQAQASRKLLAHLSALDQLDV